MSPCTFSPPSGVSFRLHAPEARRVRLRGAALATDGGGCGGGAIGGGGGGGIDGIRVGAIGSARAAGPFDRPTFGAGAFAAAASRLVMSRFAFFAASLFWAIARAASRSAARCARGVPNRAQDFRSVMLEWE